MPTKTASKTSINRVLDRKGKRNHSKTKLNTLSFFSGAMGLDLGLEKAGFNILLAAEIDTPSRNTIVANDSKVGLIGDILKYSVNDILNYANLKNAKQVDVIVGGPPCQAFSTAGNRTGFADARGNVFLKYVELITSIKPKYVVIENVRGLLSVPMTIDLHDDITQEFNFDPKKIAGSALYYIRKKLEAAGYSISFNLYNSANFGVPQIRERVVIICSRIGGKVPHLIPTHSNEKEFGLLPWVTFKDAVAGLGRDNNEHINFSEKRLKYIQMLKPGENWRNLPKEMQPEAMGGSYLLGGGKTGFYRRLAWNKPAPTLVTHPAMPATELAHPQKDRPLTVQEYKRVQQFPDEWELQGNTLDKYRQVGNAVPVGLGYAIGKTILDHFKKKKGKSVENFPYSRYKNTSEVEWEIAFLKSVEDFKKVKKISKASVQELDLSVANG